ncbi:hypothetical protein RGI145_24140 (plasmid) [Roseomonas gilardii]|uniref:Uncharacterized protein n=1 Tax=Roseomonas gilardii TaxID=257708 RepID=A0A1L7ANU9_9PROT|nr:hypothetical protein RGI145_24140 [Roseomonas gilardii]
MDYDPVPLLMPRRQISRSQLPMTACIGIGAVLADSNSMMPLASPMETARLRPSRQQRIFASSVPRTLPS